MIVYCFVENYILQKSLLTAAKQRLFTQILSLSGNSDINLLYLTTNLK